jgi:hypothetical protein
MDLPQRIYNGSRYDYHRRGIAATVPAGPGSREPPVNRSMLLFARDHFRPDQHIENEILRDARKRPYSEFDYHENKTLLLAVNDKAQELIQSYDALSLVIEGFVDKTRAIFGQDYLEKYMWWEVLNKIKLLADGGIMIRVSSAFFSP